MFDRWRGGVLMGRLADRFGVVVPAVLGALMLGIGYAAAASATALWQFMLAQALLIGMLGSSATFGPLVADVSLWFVRHLSCRESAGDPSTTAQCRRPAAHDQNRRRIAYRHVPRGLCASPINI